MLKRKYYQEGGETEGLTDEEKREDLHKTWSSARAKLGITGTREKQELERADRLWKDYIEDLLTQQSEAFKTRNLWSTLGSKVLGGLGSLYGSRFESPWAQPALTAGGVTLGQYMGPAASTMRWIDNPQDIQPDYAQFAKDYDISDMGEGKFFKGERAGFQEGIGLDIEDIKDAMGRAYSEEQTANILTGLTDIYGIHKISQDEDLAWLYDLFGNLGREKAPSPQAALEETR